MVVVLSGFSSNTISGSKLNVVTPSGQNSSAEWSPTCPNGYLHLNVWLPTSIVASHVQVFSVLYFMSKTGSLPLALPERRPETGR